MKYEIKMAAAWFVIMDENQRRNRNEVRVMRKILRDTQNPFEIPETRFQEL